MPGTILLKHCMAVATMNASEATLRDCDILVEGREIKAVGVGIAADGAETIDCNGMVAVPGLVNTHHHLYQVLTRNLPAVQNAKLFDWLIYLYEIWRGVTPELEYAAARAGLGELLLTGCTTAADHHYVFPRGIGNELIDAEVTAARELGIRFNPLRGSMSRGRSNGGLPPDDVCQTEDEILRDSAAAIDAHHDAGRLSMCRVALAPCSPFSVTPGLMRDTATLARERSVHFHTHLCETCDEEQYCLAQHGKRPLQFVRELGWVGEDVWFCHGIHFNDEEIDVLGSTRTGVTHCPTSNLRLGSGIAPVRALIDAGARVGLAVDGSASNDSSNMLKEVQLAMLVQRVKAGVDSMPAGDALRLATRGGAEVLGRDDIGSIQPGKAADIAVFDLQTIAYAGSLSDPVAALLYCGIDQRAWLTMVNGRIVVREKQLVTADEHEIAERANAAAAALCANL
jgi:cytosine/adenosine deaminase-related metal-dependent hydrolase